MVHRIQNRNPGYSDFNVAQNGVQLNSIKSETIASTSGANALKLDTNELKNTETEMYNSMVDENMALSSISVDKTNVNVNESKIMSEEIPLNLDHGTEINQDNLGQENANGLENFELSEESPQLFNDLDEVKNETDTENFNSETEEDELEIPAFLRRQKN